ncbi:YceD family protein [Rhodopseudomonas palustris]|uniref:YceD family protein n=1 Tax=Rhodopseudomonas palustris TaxID=1076 RepID=UPI000E5C3618|nr:DUF177 domain-containing protein [Rhodopseudomonas palustris]QLH71778.1 DUF177 domain-containing protein [Rhodopseudomonas palustris]RIA00986.1 DUF177 domain-containing protein [Rhodopseudomonas palustris]
MASENNPWSVPVVVMQIPETGLHRDITASTAECEAISALGDLRGVSEATASFDLKPFSDGRVHLTGRVRAKVTQTCVVTLDPVDNVIDEQVDLTFLPPEQIRELADSVDDDGEPDPSDPPEAIERGIIDIGRVATDALYLGLDPYPRKPDAVFEPMVDRADPDMNPFAALKALQQPADSARSRKPKKG